MDYHMKAINSIPIIVYKNILKENYEREENYTVSSMKYYYTQLHRNPTIIYFYIRKFAYWNK